LQEVYTEHRDRGLVVLGVDSQDYRQDARAFMKRFGLTYPVVYDGRGSTLGAWGVVGFPETFFVDRNGNLVGERIQGGVDIERNREAFDRGVELALADQ
jgi:cytochrome c biogenesis protein CcmG/thiol:disulfide interchange protein DsbE